MIALISASDLFFFLVELAHASAFKEGNTRESIDKRQRHLPLFNVVGSRFAGIIGTVVEKVIAYLKRNAQIFPEISQGHVLRFIVRCTYGTALTAGRYKARCFF